MNKMQKLQNISRLPVPTWSWLSINSASLDIEDIKSETAAYTPMKNAVKGVEITSERPQEVFDDALVLKEAAEFVRENCNQLLHIKIEKNEKVSEPIILDFKLSDGETLVNNLYITAEEGSKATVVVRYESDDESMALHCGYVHANVKENAQLQYIGVQNLGENDTHLDAFQGNVKANGKLDSLMTELGANKISVSADIQLEEESAEGGLDCIYVGLNDSDKDYNYRVEFAAKETIGSINIKGVLGGNARKTMKSTIDFISGASGSKGKEGESVLVLSDTAINRSTPLLLCGEDNVEGEHATSIGKPNKEKLYYLMTRGFSEKEAKKLLVEASLIPILDKIEQEDLREELTALVREVVRNAE